MKRVTLVFALGLIAISAAAQTAAKLAPTPPMGWNSWDSYGLTVTEAEFKANAEWLHEHLQRYGWRYVVVDEGWYLAHPENSAHPGYTLSKDGRYLPAIDRFPSVGAEDSFKPIADYVHSLGLKFGIHIIRGIPREAVEKNLPIAGSNFHAAEAADRSDTCQWNSDNYGVRDNAAGQAYYDSLMRLYAGWGVDFVKVDCISSPYKAASIQMIDRAIAKTGRPIVLSLSPGPTPLSDADAVVKSAQMWRISNDFWDLWRAKNDQHGFPQNLMDQFALLAAWEPYAGPGHWPDGDMLPVGYLGPRPGWGKPRQSRLTHTEVRTLLTLWSIARSPLILGANLTHMDPATERLLTNPEVLAVDQHTIGNHAVQQTGHASNPHANDIAIWTAKEGDDTVLAVFNRTDREARVNMPPWQKLGDQFALSQPSYMVRDLWLRRNIGRRRSLSVVLPAHGAALYRLSK